MQFILIALRLIHIAAGAFWAGSALMLTLVIQPDGVAFPETMPWQNADKMTDDDLAALYAYLTAPVQ